MPRTIKIYAVREITDEQAEEIARVIEVFRPDLPKPLSDSDLSHFVSGIAAAQIDKMLKSEKTSTNWTFDA